MVYFVNGDAQCGYILKVANCFTKLCFYRYIKEGFNSGTFYVCGSPEGMLMCKGGIMVL